MNFKKFTYWHDSGLGNSAKCLRFTLFTARSENNDFRDSHQNDYVLIVSGVKVDSFAAIAFGQVITVPN